MATPARLHLFSPFATCCCCLFVLFRLCFNYIWIEIGRELSVFRGGWNLYRICSLNESSKLPYASHNVRFIYMTCSYALAVYNAT